MDGLHKTGSSSTTNRAVLYARVSSDDKGKDGRNLAGQLEMCREYALKHGWRVVAELAEDDKGASGAAFELPELNQALEMAQAGDFDVLVVRELDRLSRNLAKQLIVEEELRRADVQVEYALTEYPDTPEGRLNKHIRATIAEYEREKIAERTVRAKRLKVKAGNVMVFGRAPYGYEVAEVGAKTVLVIYEPEARIVRFIYIWYTGGDGENGPMGITDITRKLTEMGIPTRTDTDKQWRRTKKRERGEWSRGVVYSILKRETYVGTWHYGKRASRSQAQTYHPKDLWLPVEVPAIVSQGTWKAAQARLAENRKHTRRKAKYEYLMGRHLVCGKCGLKVTGGGARKSRGKTYLYYRCPAVFRKAEIARDCDAPSFRADQVDAVVWEWVRSFLTDPQALEHGLWEVHQEREKENAPIRDRLAVVDDLIADNRAQLERLLDLYLSGEFPKEVLTDRKARLEETISGLERERTGLVAHLEAQVLSVEQIRTIQEFAAKVGQNLEAMEDDFRMKRRLIEELDVRATLTVEDGQKVIYARCMFAKQSVDLLSDTSGQRF